MDAASTSAISATTLQQALASRTPPIVIDVRRAPTFTASTEMIAGALTRDPGDVAAWAGSLPKASKVVVYCVHGHEVSQGSQQDEHVPQLMKTESAWEKIQFFGGIDHRAEGVDQPADEHPDQHPA